LYSSPNNIRVIKSRRVRSTDHVALMREMKIHTKFWLENLKGRDHLEELDIDGRIMLE
jgi:hypothetical protein